VEGFSTPQLTNRTAGATAKPCHIGLWSCCSAGHRISAPHPLHSSALSGPCYTSLHDFRLSPTPQVHQAQAPQVCTISHRPPPLRPARPGLHRPTGFLPGLLSTGPAELTRSLPLCPARPQLTGPPDLCLARHCPSSPPGRPSTDPPDCPKDSPQTHGSPPTCHQPQEGSKSA
jgi:hypothetical protein